MFIVAVKLASKRNSNDLIIFLATPAYRRQHRISVSGISVDGRAPGPIVYGDVFTIPSGRGGVCGTGGEEMRRDPADRKKSQHARQFPPGSEKAPMVEHVA